MKILVTGGAGYVGSNLVDVLIAQGHEVTVVDNLPPGKIDNIGHLLDRERFRFLNETRPNESLVERLTDGVDLAYHLAAVVGVKNVVANPLRCIQVNVLGTEAVLHAANRYGKRAVVASNGGAADGL